MHIDAYRESWNDLDQEERKTRLRIRKLNDLLRCEDDHGGAGDLVVCMGDLAACPLDVQQQVFDAARSFTAFTEDNDPHGEHDCASFELDVGDGPTTFMFKIDYYDLDLEMGSEDPSDPKTTRRVLTLMFAHDY